MPDPEELLWACVQMLPVDGASLVLRTDAQGWHRIAATDEVAARIDEVQRRVAEGPGVEAVATGLPVQVPDWPHATTRWPRFAASLGTEATGAMFGLPLTTDTTVLGVLNLYRTRPGTVDPRKLNAAWLAADAIARQELNLGDSARNDQPGP
jgi:transcriptional regulator with GAF, ATPase, and Fis domain